MGQNIGQNIAPNLITMHFFSSLLDPVAKEENSAVLAAAAAFNEDVCSNKTYKINIRYIGKHLNLISTHLF